jgi:hypothetical protein
MMRISVIVPELCKTALINGTIGAILGLKGGMIVIHNPESILPLDA